MEMFLRKMGPWRMTTSGAGRSGSGLSTMREEDGEGEDETEAEGDEALEREETEPCGRRL